MATISQSQFLINGVIDTSKTVIQNLQSITAASGCWLSYDIAQGKWAVTINQAGSSVASFNDSNIIGGINISSTGLTELYNSVEIEYPHKDLKDRKDYITFSIADGSRYPNEPDNVLELQTDLVNDPVQAAYIASRELKQSRVDKVIEFRTDFSKLGLKAGDLIDVTNAPYGYTNKVFRIVSIQEDDADDGVLSLSIQALEYDADVYSTAGLERKDRFVDNGIITKDKNTATKSSDNQATLPLDLSGIAKALGLSLLFNSATGRYQLSQSGAQANIAGDSAIITWAFTDGTDLDIRCAMYYPNIGQTDLQQYIGWTGSPVETNSTSVWPPPPAVPVMVWGGDNTGSGTENVYINLERLKELYPTAPYYIVECRANWYTTPGINPVKFTPKMYQGGTIRANGFGFTNTGYTKVRNVVGIETFIDSNSQSQFATGDLMGYFVFDPVDNVAYFTNDVTGLV